MSEERVGGEATDVVIQQNKEEAEILKNDANELFKNQHYDEAITLYSKCIELDPMNAVYYANRSISYLRMECFGYALTDASNAIKFNRTYLKGYYRRAAAHMSLGKFKLALKDFEYITKLRPNDDSVSNRYLECQKIVTKMNFEKAIAGDQKHKSILDTLNLEAMTIEDKYDGPKLENEKVTLEFVKELMETYKSQKKLHRRYAYKVDRRSMQIYMTFIVFFIYILFNLQILVDIKAYFEKQPSLVNVTIPPKNKFTVCGDIHGQFYDLMNIFHLNGLPSSTNPYLFNGDFVDRGSFSVECIFTLFSFKLLYPDHFFMSRGNHESSTMNQMYGFEGEVKAKYSEVMAELFTEVYNWLPLAHCLNNKVLVMHGGLFSEDNVTLKDIASIDRNRQPPAEGIMCELLWSDPQPGIGRAPSKRGVGCHFGPDITENFLKLNNLQYIIRSHEVKNEGYEVTHNGKCITVFSAPNYCDSMDNKGAFITMTGEDLTPKFTSYEAVPHPDVKPMAFASPLLNLLG